MLLGVKTISALPVPLFFMSKITAMYLLNQANNATKLHEVLRKLKMRNVSNCITCDYIIKQSIQFVGKNGLFVGCMRRSIVRVKTA